MMRNSLDVKKMFNPHYLRLNIWNHGGDFGAFYFLKKLKTGSFAAQEKTLSTVCLKHSVGRTTDLRLMRL